MNRFSLPAHALLAVTSLIVTSLGSVASAQSSLPCWNPNLGTNLNLIDEDISAPLGLGFSFAYGGQTYTDIQVCDNGYITLGATGGQADFDPDPATLVADPFARICPFWVDLEPDAPGSGNVWFNAVPASGNDPAYAVITWLDVFEYQGMTPHTFQLVLVDGGAIRTSYDSNLSQNSGPWLIGASPGNGVSQNAVSLAALPIQTAGNATLHDHDLVGSPAPITDGGIDWAPDGSGGFDLTALSGCATTANFGRGCVGGYTSFYEWFQNTPGIDLSNSAFDMLFTGNGYLVTTSTTTFVAPTGAAANLNLADDAETTITLASALAFPGGSTTTLNVTSNGILSTASNNAAFDFSPTPTEFLGWPSTTWAIWHDLIPDDPASGGVFFEEIGNLSIITWDAVVGYVGQTPGTTPSTFQFQFDRTTGNVAFVFGALDTTSVSTWPGGDGWLIGYTPGGPSLDGGSTDLTTTLATGTIATATADLAPLTLTASDLPVINTTINLTTSEMTSTAIFGGLLLGFQKFDPGMDLTGFGMPGCFQFNDQLAVLLFFPQGATSVTLPFNVPNFPGARVIAQSACYDPTAALTPLGATSSNGVELRFGL
ncbi:MAG: hypothetical protein NXI31_09745 [bacterium]|nr:hypothetical protein [bacterium]